LLYQTHIKSFKTVQIKMSYKAKNWSHKTARHKKSRTVKDIRR
jgi:hypothetical protein